jgi:hypothetical protein
MQDADPVCGFFEDRCQLPGTGFGGRPSALGLDKGGGKVVPPSPLNPPWPRTEPGDRLSGTWDLVPGTGAGPTPRAGYRAPKTEPDH